MKHARWILLGFAFWFTIPSLAIGETLVKAAVLEVTRPQSAPISRLDLPPEDNGFAGGDLATQDNNTTGKFMGQTYETIPLRTTPEEATAALDALIAQGVHYVVTIANAQDLLALADHAKDRDVLFFNASAPDDALRNDDCRPNIMHVAPSRAMLADAMAQYLIWKNWRNWFLVYGSHDKDKHKADAYRRAAKKFGANIIEERVFEDTGGARRTDSGFVLIQKQIPVFTQRVDPYDVLVVADESQIFGAHLPYRNWDPRPVAGDAGLIAQNWHPASEFWGGTQLQTRFETLAKRYMNAMDYQVWESLRALGEAVTRSGSADEKAIRDYLRSDAFELAAFKGQKVTFRPWNNQLRQPILLSDNHTIISVSPQKEFLHQVTQLDTLGYDEPESTCSFQ